MPKLTQDELRRLIEYDPHTGVFTRKMPTGIGGRFKAGEQLGNTHSKGYINIPVRGRSYYAHRLAFLYMVGYLPEQTVDHINRDRSDNRWSNLREASHQCQSRNCKLLINNTSGVKGVYWSKADRKWIVNIKIKRKTYYLGIFDCKLEAAYHRLAAEQCLGFPECDINSSAAQFIRREHFK